MIKLYSPKIQRILCVTRSRNCAGSCGGCCRACGFCGFCCWDGWRDFHVSPMMTMLQRRLSTSQVQRWASFSSLVACFWILKRPKWRARALYTIMLWGTLSSSLMFTWPGTRFLGWKSVVKSWRRMWMRDAGLTAPWMEERMSSNVLLGCQQEREKDKI